MINPPPTIGTAAISVPLASSNTSNQPYVAILIQNNTAVPLIVQYAAIQDYISPLGAYLIKFPQSVTTLSTLTLTPIGNAQGSSCLITVYQVGDPLPTVNVNGSATAVSISGNVSITNTPDVNVSGGTLDISAGSVTIDNGPGSGNAVNVAPISTNVLSGNLLGGTTTVIISSDCVIGTVSFLSNATNDIVVYLQDTENNFGVYNIPAGAVIPPGAPLQHQVDKHLYIISPIISGGNVSYYITYGSV